MEGAAPVAEEYGSKMQLNAPEGSVVVEMDSRRIDRILRNLILNALEHGEGRAVNISVASNADAVAVTVRDHGIGMSPAEAARVFDRFWRADPARARTTGGSGLGLSIATEDTKLHNGWLQAWGNTGVGSNFRLTLPLKQGGTITKSPLPLEPADVGFGRPGDHSVLVLGPGATPVLEGSAPRNSAPKDAAAAGNADAVAGESAAGASPAKNAEPAAAAPAGTPETARTGERS
jgi:two-component system sensor histidine kinase MtrB